MAPEGLYRVVGCSEAEHAAYPPTDLSKKADLEMRSDVDHLCLPE